MRPCPVPPVLALCFVAHMASPAAALQVRERDPGPWGEPFEEAPPGPPRLDVAFGFGTAFSSDWSDQVVLETRDPSGARTTRVLLPEMSMAPGPVLAGAVTYWRGRLGVRLQGAFARACVTAGETSCDAAPDPETAVRFVTDVDVWSYGLQGVIGLTRDQLARVLRPYALIGASGVTFDPKRPVPGTGIPEGVTTPGTGGGDVIIIDGTTDLVLTMDRLGFETRFAAGIGAGLDLRLPLAGHGIGVRLELVDQIMSSPVGTRLTRLGGGLAGGTDVVEIERPLVHTLLATLSAVLDIGLPEPPPPAAATAP